MRKYRKPYRVRKKKSILKNRFLGFGILILVIIGSFFYILFFSEIFQVKQIIVTGEEKVSKENLELLIEKKLENKILFFKTKSIFLVNSNEIKKDILNNFPKIAEIEIRPVLPDLLNIIVIERVGLAIWCQEDCFLLDNEGIIFEQISEKDFQNFKIKNLTFKEDFKLGDRIIEKEIISQILDIEKKLKELNIEIKEFTIVSEERLNAKTFEDWEIYFNSRGDINWQITELKLVLEKQIPPEKRRDIEYIDLRFSKVFYKYR